MRGNVKMELDLLGELMTTVRLATGGISSAVGLSLDGGEDCKVCVTESLLLLKHGGFLRAELIFKEQDGLAVEITGTGDVGIPTEGAEDEISVALLSALAQDVVMHKEGGAIRKIQFSFRKEA